MKIRLLVIASVMSLLIQVGRCDEPRTALIPFSKEMPPKSEIESHKGNRGYASFNAPDSSSTSDGNTLSYKLGSSTLTQHLIWDHECPDWVAEYYKTDTVNLLRIHRGLGLQEQADRYQKDADKYLEWMSVDREGTVAEKAARKKDIYQLREYALKKRDEALSKIVIYKVTEPPRSMPIPAT